MYLDGTQKVVKRQKVHGFMKRMSTKAGQNILRARRAKGRTRVAI
jgi:large subunit ribosomal protein L34